MTEERARYDAGPPGQPPITPGALLPFTAPGYCEPSPNDVRAVMRRKGLTGSRVGDLVGVDTRTVRKWTGGERAMPYSAWRLLLLETGITTPDDGPTVTIRVGKSIAVGPDAPPIEDPDWDTSGRD